MNLWKIVLQESWQRRWRLLVSVLSLVFATGLIVAIQSLNSSSRKAVDQYMKNLGTNMIVIPAELDLLSFYSADPADLGRANMPESNYFRLLEAGIEGVVGIDPRLTVPLDINGIRAVLTGIFPSKMLRPGAKGLEEEDPWEAVASLTPDSNGVVFGAEVKEILESEDRPTTEVPWREMEVLTILPSQGTLDDLRIYVHLRSLQKWFDRPFSLSEIRLLYTGSKDLEKVASELEGILGNTRVVTQTRLAKKQIEVMDSIQRYALMLLGVILALGWISIGNEMYHNVQERKREIGILMALGGTTNTILAIFILKAVFLALFGGLLGCGLGILAVLFVGPLSLQVTVYPSFSLIPLAVLMAVLLGVLSSMAPSWRASKMDPAEILLET